jgi:colanic acid biosynthesis glycosyl transferase WcaI
MSATVLIDYGCHSFTYRLATHLGDLGFPILYFANGSLESPNLSSLAAWVQARPHLVRSISCEKPYGKLGLYRRLAGEIEWARRCMQALEKEDVAAVIVSCVPLAAVTRIQKWAEHRGIPLIYWLQDLQGRAIHDLLGRKLGLPGRVLGSFAYLWEQHILEKSRMVITIADGHERDLPLTVRQAERYVLLENWGNIEEFPQFRHDNAWAVQHGLDKTLNVLYSGTLGLKHDLSAFISVALSFRDRSDVRVVVVSSGHAAEALRAQAAAQGLSNLIVLPFQPYGEVPKVLASAAVLVAPLEASAGGFCVPSKVLSYLCAGRPTVIAIDAANPAATTIQRVGAGDVVEPGDVNGFVDAVAEFLNNAPSREAAGRRARRYAEETFGLEQVTQKFLNIVSSSNIYLGPDSPWTTRIAAKSAAASA